MQYNIKNDVLALNLIICFRQIINKFLTSVIMARSKNILHDIERYEHIWAYIAHVFIEF